MSQELLSKGFQLVCKVDDIEEDDMEEFQVNGSNMLIIRLEDQFYATQAICSHEYSRLSEGELEDDCITCPLHFSRFDLRDGSPIDPPASQPLKIYTVRVQDEEIWVNTASGEENK